MDILKIGVLGVAGVLLLLPLKQQRPEFAELISLSVCVCILVYIVIRLGTAMGMIVEITDRLGVQRSYIRIILKMVGITYVGEFAADICRESGHAAIAGQIEMFAKVSLFSLSIPVLQALIENIEVLL